MDLPTFLTVLPIGGSAVYAFIKVGMVAGRTDSRLGNLTTGLSELTQSLRAFADKADERLTDHGERLARLEEARTAHSHKRSEDT